MVRVNPSAATVRLRISASPASWVCGGSCWETSRQRDSDCSIICISAVAMVIADTGFWLALANRNDRHHRAAKEALDGLSEGLITTWPVLTETCHLFEPSMPGPINMAVFAHLWRNGSLSANP